MALKSWLASIKSDVTGVTPVQATIHAGLRCNGIETADVTGVTDSGCGASVETSVTAVENQTLQPEPAWALGCTLVTSVTCKKINTEAHAANEPLTGGNLTAPPEPKRIFRQRGPRLNPAEQQAARAYHGHHFNCPTCIAAGRGDRYGRRCAVGLALWNDYTGAGDLQTEGGQHGQA